MIEEPKITTIASWFGSNRMLAAAVGEELAGSEWVGIPFFGGGTELRYINARTIVAADLHRHVINLAQVMADPAQNREMRRRLRGLLFHPDVLADAQKRCRAREEYTALNNIIGTDRLFGSPTEAPVDFADNIGWAVDYFVCSWMGRSGTMGTDSEFRAPLSVRWEAGGGDSVVRFRNMIESARAWQRILRRATFQCMDVFDFLGMVKDRPGHTVYLDPPFPDAGDAYKHKFTPALQRRLATTLAKFEHARIVCRFYIHPLIEELYPEGRWTYRRMVGRDMANQAKPEVLIINGDSHAGGGA
jgi:site-specific DNA-adenine methylase